MQKGREHQAFNGMERYLADALSTSWSDRQFDRIHSMATAEPFEFDLARGAEPDVGLAFDRLAHRFAARLSRIRRSNRARSRCC